MPQPTRLRNRNFPGRGDGHAYGRAGMVGPTHPGRRPGPTTGFDSATALQWAKDHKWHLLGGGLILGAALALAFKDSLPFGHDLDDLDFGDF